MDHSSLRRLADEGIAAFPPLALPDLAAWCWDIGETTGDARYCSLSRSIGQIEELFEPVEAVPQNLVRHLDGLLARTVGDILQADSAEAGSILARSLREDISLTIANFS